MTVVLGVLPTGYGLVERSEESEGLVDDVVDDFTNRPTYDVTSYQAFAPDPGDPDAHYDYTFTLWRLNGADRPTETVVTYHDP